MSNILDIRNPKDLTTTYEQIEIYRDTNSDMSTESLLTTKDINTATASDLSTGYTSYTDTNGDDTHYYRFRYKNNSVYSSKSDIFQAGTTVMHARFRKKMRDTNSSNYFFSNDEVSEFLTGAIGRLFPHTYNEAIDESLSSVANQEKYSFPVGVNRVNDLELLNAQGEVESRPKNFKIRARQIIFDNPLASGYTMRLYVDKMFTKLAEIPEFLDDLVLDLMRLQAYETLEADRHRYYKYTSVVEPDGGSLPSIRDVIQRITISTERRLNALRRVRRPSDIKLM